VRILQVSTSDQGGGAERIARQLHEALLAGGHPVRLAVGRKQTTLPGVVQIPNEQSRDWLARSFSALADALGRFTHRSPHLHRLTTAIRFCGQPRRVLDYLRGKEDFDYPGTRRLIQLSGLEPQLVHCHNLHGGYFDLRYLPALSRAVPVALTLHDTWLLSGHCAYSLNCPRWRTGCGRCPDLSLYPAIRRDATAYNWRRKADIARRSRVHVAAPSRWLMNQVEQSLLAPAILTRRVIPNGIDLAAFHPGDRLAARAALGIPPEARVLMFAATRTQTSPFKDYATLERAIEKLADCSTGQPILSLAVGEGGETRRWGAVEQRFIGFVANPELMAQYYRAADLYIHAARAETFGLVIAEALACGTPVVASAVGGIPEIVRALGAPGADAPTGVLVPPQDPDRLAAAIEHLLGDDNLRTRLGENAVRDARARFGFTQMFNSYLDWYSEILTHNRTDTELRRMDRA
jgi:glycosyltransferase involved in cell wall biosynthesis